MSNRRDIQFTYNPHNKLTLLDCSFIVDSTNGNGFGIRTLNQSGRVLNVFMHTTVTPGKSAAGYTNPNPEAGIIMVSLQDNYNTYLGGAAGFVSPSTGSPISTGLTIGAPYTIASVGATTQAQFLAAGLPIDITPAPNVSFVAAATSIAGGATVLAAGISNIDHIEVIGDANLMNANSNAVAGSLQRRGMQLILACYKNGVLTAPNDNTVIGLTFHLNNSAQGV